MSDNLHEECGVFGIFGSDDAALDTYYGLYALQHRGQESCGIAMNIGGVISEYKGFGLVADVFTAEKLSKLRSGQAAGIAVGHCNYGSAKLSRSANIQPLVVQHIKGGMALAHNGNILNAVELREGFERRGAIFHTTCDTEAIAYAVTEARLSAPSIQAAVSRAMDRLEGAYSLVVMSPKKLIAARDPRGFRPLCLGRRGGSWIVASESCAVDIVGGQFVRDILPGEIITVSDKGIESDVSHCGGHRSVCVFEFIYFARPDSVIDGVSVHRYRVSAGERLAECFPVEADIVIGVPDSGLDAAMGYAGRSGIPYDFGFIKNRYVGRTFIQPVQSMRADAVRIKLNALRAAVEGKRVIAVDDSIVRGTTSAPTMQMLREAGAREVHMRVYSPPFRYPCWFGTDVPPGDSLLANGRDEGEMAKVIDVDSLKFLPLEICRELAGGLGVCTGCFTGEYPVKTPEKAPDYKYERAIDDAGE